MDNPLTPNKILRLMHLAEDKSFNVPRRIITNDPDFKYPASTQHTGSSTTHYESSGILDLERVEGFGESGVGSMSLSKSTAFHPGEMTGRSTEAEDLDTKPLEMGPSRLFEEYGRHSLALDSITSHMDKQTLEINDIMRHSIATNYSFHSKRDLTADEASLVMREAPLPVQQSTQINFQESMLINNSNMSVGAYFKNRCPEFGKILGKTDSPDRSMNPSITDVSLTPIKPANKGANHTYNMDQSLDCVPTRQPRIANNEKPSDRYTAAKMEIPDCYGNKIINQIDVSNIKTDKMYTNSNKPMDVQKNLPMSIKNFSSMTSGHKSFKCSSKPTDVLLRNLQSSLHLVPEDTEGSMENSLSISKIADYLGKQSNVSVTDMLQLNHHAKQINKKQPLSELHMNLLDNKRGNEIPVTTIKDTRKIETASSASTIDTVISLRKLQINQEIDVPTVTVTRESLGCETQVSEVDDHKTNSRSTRSKSPSSKSQSTLSTVQENISSFKSADSPLHNSKGEANTSYIPYSNVDYKELDNSIDWHEVLQQKHLKQEGLAKEQWADIVTSPVNGFVGVSCAVTITVTTLTDNWLTAKFDFVNLPNQGKDLTIELPRFPLLLSPGKSEQFVLHITSNVEMNMKLPFTMSLKDASIDGDIEQKGVLELCIKMPTVQSISCDGLNLLCFPSIPENTSLTKYFVLISDSLVDLQLELSIAEGNNMFVIKNVQEITKDDINKALMERQGSMEDGPPGKTKGKAINKQLCRLTGGNAIKVTMMFNAPKLSEMEVANKTVTFNGTLNVHLLGVKTIIKKVNLIGNVGSANLVVQSLTGKLRISNEPTTLNMCNAGTVTGVWVVKFKSSASEYNFPFKVSPSKFELRPGGNRELNIVYTGSPDTLNEATLILEDVATGNTNTIEICGGTEKPKVFPVKTNYNIMSWVRTGRKELSLKNSTDKKIQIRCQIVGEGFSIDMPGVESRGTYCLSFGPCECRPLPIVFAPNSFLPHTAALHLVFDKNSDFSRKVKLHGCASGDPVRWSGLVTYGDTALVRAVFRMPIELTLYNKSPVPAFIAARIQFNLQYRWCGRECAVAGGRRVVAARARHAVCVRVPWPQLERRARAPHAAPHAAALATLSVLAGPEVTRRRILRILREESNGGEMNTSLLPDHLKVLAEQFEGEDTSLDKHLENFNETKTSLNDLIEGLHELTAQIDLPQDFTDDNTILISDDTVIEHHTLCD